ncbi:type I restriction enzyme HsdR N-terminal domain-containing protein [Chlamydia crocodili]|uniref:Type I restriction enzyme HsdR N-terminal domain-containing protein n=1 Tax=Chlamydia crocodili TaxID=2766982 RepID=A0ABX8CEQ9_9CHLA|nr:type I restriction enzyme HsdR N-terminal domain-containing protein [Chlamydia crocodili]QVE48708.1 type I restriction enzyme HsdR N-terminal domain-containing protein [Chlamydia crocodili]
MSSSSLSSPQDFTSSNEQISTNPDSLKIFDPIRHKILASTPEEKVRQELIAFLIEELLYPPSLIIVEKGLKTLFPLLTRKDIRLPRRRPDLLIITPATYTNLEGETYNLGNPKPLLLIECKARVINQQTINQLLSYNYIIGAPCLSVVCYRKQQTGFLNPKTQTLDFYPGLPSYPQLLSYYLKLNSAQSIN